MSDPDSVSQSSALTMTGAPQGGGASRTGAPQRGGGLPSAGLADGGASRPGEPPFPDFRSESSMPTLRGRTTPRGGRLRAGDVLLGRYTVLSELGEGGMGVVYKCLDSVGGIEVALKCLPPELSRNEAEMDGIRENYGIVARLHHSAISGLRQLEKDPDFGEYYLVMDLAEGEDLSALLRRRRGAPMPPAEALAILRPLASALDYAHAEKVLHRDVKPGNVKVDGSRVQLLDFGLAAEVRSSMSRVSFKGHAGSSGTPAYMAPEQWEARRQSAATDQYALAVMAYQMLSGALPFDADNTDLLRRAVLSRDADPAPGLPRAANAALLRALAKEPAARFPSCGAFVDALGSAFESGGGRRRFHLALAAILLAGVAAAAVFFTQSRRAAEGGASRPGEPQGGGGLQSAVTARPEASPHLALPPDGASVEELRAARTAALDALDARRERFEPDDSPDSAALLAAVSSLDARIAAALAAFSAASDLAAAKERSAEIVAAAAWIEETAPVREEIDAAERAIDAMKADLASAEASKYAKAKLGAAETARSDAGRLLARSRYAEAKAKCDEAKRLYDEALSSASAARAAAKAKEALALADAAKIREDWDAVIVQSEEALRYEPQNASALALKREAETEKRKIAEAKAEAERKAAKGGASRPGEPQGGGGLQSAVGAQGGASRPGEPQGGGGLQSAVGANGGLETAAPLVGTRTVVRVGSQEIAMRWCPPGSFTMGSPSSEDGHDSGETQHRVTLSKGFYMGETEVTQGLWQEVMGANPSDNTSFFFSHVDYPVENVSWNDCKNFLRKLNAKAPSGWRFALPTEAQWEYACRAGTSGAYGGSGNIDEMGWYSGNSGNKTHPVAQKRANAWGLYDMHGNVWEYCAASGGIHVLRGGCSWLAPQFCRSANRSWGGDPGFRRGDYGFRLLAFQDGK